VECIAACPSFQGGIIGNMSERVENNQDSRSESHTGQKRERSQAVQQVRVLSPLIFMTLKNKVLSEHSQLFTLIKDS
jgi:hypothetical protein